MCAGGLPQPGPIFQALPEPLPLPPLPQPQRPAEAMAPGMAPETAPAGLPQPGTVLQVFPSYPLCGLCHRKEHCQMLAVWICSANLGLFSHHLCSV